MILKNAYIYDENFCVVKKDILIENGVIQKTGDCLSGSEEMDFSSCTILPGFIDIHIHGCNLADVCDASTDSLETMSAFLTSKGITSFCPATMTLPREELRQIFSCVEAYKGKEKGAYIHGINMEGPYLSREKKGAQKGEFIRTPDTDEWKELNGISRIAVVDIAPEVQNSLSFAKAVSGMCRVSAAHTNADYDQAVEGFESGITHATHLFNAMTGITARNPGVAGAVFDTDGVTAELICDGFHLAPAVLRMAFRLLGEDRTVVISDSMKAAGCQDGDYELGGQTVYVRGGKAMLADGTIAASTTNLYEEYLNLLSFGLDEKQVVKSCTINPAKVVGADRYTGSIEAGKNADLLVLDKDRKIKAVFVKGVRK